MYYLGVDIGGTNIVVGVVDENYKIIEKLSFKTAIPRSEESICDDIANTCFEVVKNAEISMDDVYSIGIGAPGSANPKTGVVEYCANLLFDNWNLVDMIQKRTNKKVFIENDANAAAFAEYIAGAAKGAKNAVAVTLGTGIGGGIIIDGKLYSGSNYCGAEIGHMVIEHGGTECSCGRKGCFEKYASTKALVRMSKDMLLEHDCEKTSLMWSLIENDIEKMSGKTAFIAARKGDILAKEILSKYFDYLACGLANIINIFQPDILCIGGGISKEGDYLLNPLIEKIEKERYSRYSEKQTKICIAALGNDAGIIGAALLFKSF